MQQRGFGQHEKDVLANVNSVACEWFTDAQEALWRRNYPQAVFLISKFKETINYDLFYQQDNRTNVTPAVSVIIVTYGTNIDLVKAIKSLLAGTNDNYEIIVVDNGGNDAVVPILLELPILYIQNPINLLSSEGRNIGVYYAKSEICAFLDDDALAADNFIESIIEAFQTPSLCAVRGKVLPKTDTAVYQTANHYDLGAHPLPHEINTEGNSAWRVYEYRLLGGMDPLLFGHEGIDMTLRLTNLCKMPVTYYLPSLIIYHDFAFSEEKNITKQKRHALMHDYFVWKHGTTLLDSDIQCVKKYKNSIAVNTDTSNKSRNSPIPQTVEVNPVATSLEPSVHSSKDTELQGKQFVVTMKDSQRSYTVSAQNKMPTAPYAPYSVTRSLRKPLVSIVMPVYNEEQYILSSIESMLSQTLDDFELLVLDDGSTDSTWELINSVQDERIIKLRHESNKGLPLSRNSLLNKARGEFIAHMDADDISFPSRLELQVEWMRSYPDLWACGGWHTYLEGDSISTRKMAVTHEAIKAAFLFGCELHNPFMMFRTAYWNRYRIRYADDVKVAEDYNLWVSTAMKYPDAQFCNIPILLGAYRKHSASTSFTQRQMLEKHVIKTHMAIYKRLGIPQNLSSILWQLYIYPKLYSANSREEINNILMWLDYLEKRNNQTNTFCKHYFNLRIADQKYKLQSQLASI